MRLLPRKSLIKTSSADHADWNYKPVLGWIQRLRFELAASLIGAQRYGRLLEIGYGSGVFMPELAKYCGELYGVDPHDHGPDVAAKLAAQGVTANLHSSGAESLPFCDDSFDCVVAVSSLEFVSDLEQVCQEIDRVLTPNGRLVVITPGLTPVIDTGNSPKDEFGDRRELILPTLQRWFSVASARTATGGLYHAIDCRRMPRTVLKPPVEEVKKEEAVVVEVAVANIPAEPPQVPKGVYPLNQENQGPVRWRYRVPGEDRKIGEMGRTTPEQVEQTILAVRRRRYANALSEESLRPLQCELAEPQGVYNHGH